MATLTWQPHNDQIVQLLVNRGHLDEDQILFARLRQALDGAPTLLDVLKHQGLVDDALVATVVKQVRQDELVRQALRNAGVLSSRELSEASRLQRGTRRSLLQTLVDEELCARATIRQVLSDVTPRADVRPFERRRSPAAYGQTGPLDIA